MGITLLLKYFLSGSKRAKTKYLDLREHYAERRNKRISRISMRKSVDKLCKADKQKSNSN